VATLEPRKNGERLVAAFEQLRDRSRDVRWRLVFAGRVGWNCGGLFDRIASSPYRDDILHVGHVDDALLADLYRACHVFVYPSLDEGFGLPVLEAMASGCVVVTSGIPVLREVAAEAACYCDPLEVEDMAGALWRAAHDGDLRRRLAASAEARAAQFSWDRAATATEQVFCDALEGTS
jgi:alpha-1,3-rhamnosyl/mannosyltransferase